MTTDQQGQKPVLVRDTACLSDGGVSAPALWMFEALLFPLMTDRITNASLPLYTVCLSAQKQAYCLLHGTGQPESDCSPVRIRPVCSYRIADNAYLIFRQALLEVQIGLTCIADGPYLRYR